ncbi:hypothetical protein BOTCAL_0871g00010 [Botryotinia calthae]|uniref:2EXR domain-containing protein n=1 Tax=Botryotinia calthae TaxID=38488 RepID=A0A4Y8CHS8_9HELO|nr:hypothetical protein BOTCAL_0871g00010 [Botryotinia calthae]
MPTELTGTSAITNIPPASFRPCDILPVASVNRESRAETLKHYLTLYQARYRYQNKTSSSDTQEEESRSNEEYLSGTTDLLLPHVMYFNQKIDCLTIVYPDRKVGSCDILAIFPLYNQEAARFLESIRKVKVYHDTVNNYHTITNTIKQIQSTTIRHRDTMNLQPLSNGRAKKSRSKKPRVEKSRAQKPQYSDKGTQTTLPPPFTGFHLFPELPIQIRRKIWRSSFERRKVELRCGLVQPTPPDHPLPGNNPFGQQARDYLICRQYRIPPIQKVPVAFVNKESRAETLRHYVRLYQDLHFPENGNNLRYPCTIYFNPKLDTPLIYANKPQYAFDKISLSLERLFPSYDSLAVEAMREIRKVDIIFMGSIISNHESYDLDGCRDALSMFDNLEEVFMMSTNIYPKFDIQALLTQYFSLIGNSPSFNRTNHVELEFWSPPDWLLGMAAPQSS